MALRADFAGVRPGVFKAITKEHPGVRYRRERMELPCHSLCGSEGHYYLVTVEVATDLEPMWQHVGQFYECRGCGSKEVVRQ